METINRSDIRWTTTPKDGMTHWQMWYDGRRIAAGICQPDGFTEGYRAQQVREYLGPSQRDQREWDDESYQKLLDDVAGLTG